MKPTQPAFGTLATIRPGPTFYLVLAGGNALGVYAAGAVEARETAGVRFDLICGASIAAITAAIVAGKPPGEAAQALRAFWALSSSGSTGAHWPAMSANHWRPLNRMPRMPERREPNPNREIREMSSTAHALQTLLLRRPVLFNPGSLSRRPLWSDLHRPWRCSMRSSWCRRWSACSSLTAPWSARKTCCSAARAPALCRPSGANSACGTNCINHYTPK